MVEDTLENIIKRINNLSYGEGIIIEVCHKKQAGGNELHCAYIAISVKDGKLVAFDVSTSNCFK